MSERNRRKGEAKTHEQAQELASEERPADRPIDRLADHWRDADDLRWAARHWAARMGVRTPAIHVRAMTTKWGSLSRVVTHASGGSQARHATSVSPYAGRLTLNSELLALPRDLGEFVIVHELVHLLAPNHGRVFKSFLHAYLPDWQAREARLRQMTSSSGARKMPHSHLATSERGGRIAQGSDVVGVWPSLPLAEE